MAKISFLLSSNISTANLIGWSIFFALLVIFFILISIFCIYRAIISKIAQSVDLIDILKRTPLKIHLQRISNINNVNKVFEQELMVWRTKYELLFEKELKKIFDSLSGIINNRKATLPLISNYKKVNEIYLTLKEIQRKVQEINEEIEDAIEIELIQRSNSILVREVFQELKEEATMLTFGKIEIDELKLANTIQQIEGFFEEFYIELEEGNYRKSWDVLYKIDNSLIFLIELLDNIPTIISTILTTVPNKLIELKNKYVTFGKVNERITKTAEQYSILEHNVDTLRIKINNELKRLQYKKANKLLAEIFDLINKFTNEVEYDDSLKNFFESNDEKMRYFIKEIDTACANIEKAHRSIKAINKAPSPEWNNFEKTRYEFLKTKELAYKIFAIIDTSSNLADLDLKTLKNNSKIVIQRALQNVENLENSVLEIEGKTSSMEHLLNDVIFVQSILSQCEVKINQHRSVPELKKYLMPINELNQAINEFEEKKIIHADSEEEKKYISEKINDLAKRAWKLSSQINDTIFLDFISQEIILYMERFVDTHPGAEQVIATAEQYYHNRHLDQLIGYSFKQINNLKSKNQRK
ncbi:septation ring formation regulator EzrA [Spiroplasma alleghenense]|uniref:Septation ring formation regulator n=1 Tax=Spiroplasma alleghenense TaxID=216931 RepID=A0A345Z454_9MOLU|nr:septation ring formation regulator EzrA [Spiroplasma alleghenense]AXK51383.1 septation ring formation regulator [Spiroplasma alleghenense]